MILDFVYERIKGLCLVSGCFSHGTIGYGGDPLATLPPVPAPTPITTSSVVRLSLDPLTPWTSSLSSFSFVFSLVVSPGPHYVFSTKFLDLRFSP